MPLDIKLDKPSLKEILLILPLIIMILVAGHFSEIPVLGHDVMPSLSLLGMLLSGIQ